jgi:hypothetical protein
VGGADVSTPAGGGDAGAFRKGGRGAESVLVSSPATLTQTEICTVEKTTGRLSGTRREDSGSVESASEPTR